MLKLGCGLLEAAIIMLTCSPPPPNTWTRHTIAHVSQPAVSCRIPTTGLWRIWFHRPVLNYYCMINNNDRWAGRRERLAVPPRGRILNLTAGCRHTHLPPPPHPRGSAPGPGVLKWHSPPPRPDALQRGTCWWRRVCVNNQPSLDLSEVNIS